MPKLEEVVPKPETRVSILVDNSSSMSSLSKFVVDSFNEQVDELRKVKDQKITVSLVFFDSYVNVKMFNVPLSEIQNLKPGDYKPSGMTALDDAIGITIGQFKNLDDWKDENISHLVVIITDGHGNVNKEFSQKNVANMIREGKNNGWTFTYLGANVNVEKVARDYNLDLGNTMSYQATGADMMRSSVATSKGLGGYFNARGRGERSVSAFYSGGSAADGENILEQAKKATKTDILDDKDLTEAKEDGTVDIHMGNKSLWDQSLDANDKLQEKQEVK